MAFGDQLSRDGEYQLADTLFNGAAVVHDAGYLVSNVDGLFGSAEVRTNDVPRQSDHGVISTQEYLGARIVTADLKVMGSSKADYENRRLTLGALFNPTGTIQTFAYRRNGVVRLIFAKPRQLALPTENDHVLLSEGSFQLYAPDPRHYESGESQVNASIAAGVSSVGLAPNNVGTFWTWPLIEIDGPVTNPRLANAQDANRQIKIDHVLAAGQTMVIDQAKRTVTVGGVDVFSSVRTDNQWIHLWPGVNNLTFSRTGTTGTTPIRVKFRSAWIF